MTRKTKRLHVVGIMLHLRRNYWNYMQVNEVFHLASIKTYLPDEKKVMPAPKSRRELIVFNDLVRPIYLFFLSQKLVLFFKSPQLSFPFHNTDFKIVCYPDFLTHLN